MGLSTLQDLEDLNCFQSVQSYLSEAFQEYSTSLSAPPSASVLAALGRIVRAVGKQASDDKNGPDQAGRSGTANAEASAEASRMLFAGMLAGQAGDRTAR